MLLLLVKISMAALHIFLLFFCCTIVNILSFPVCLLYIALRIFYILYTFLSLFLGCCTCFIMRVYVTVPEALALVVTFPAWTIGITSYNSADLLTSQYTTFTHASHSRTFSASAQFTRKSILYTSRRGMSMLFFSSQYWSRYPLDINCSFFFFNGTLFCSCVCACRSVGLGAADGSQHCLHAYVIKYTRTSHNYKRRRFIHLCRSRQKEHTQQANAFSAAIFLLFFFNSTFLHPFV